MKLIKLLSKELIDKIAAGEVVVNGASVLKELLENSIDANSKNISVAVNNGGKTLIRVSDDGDGIYKEDIPNAILRNATSKIENDIDSIATLGFRGEALASISYVSKMTLITKTQSDDCATKIEVEANKIINTESVSGNKGTIIEVKDLFYNIPARYKHLKKDSAETSEIIDIAVQIALSHPEISFRLQCDSKEIFYTDGTGDIAKCISSLLGKNLINQLIKIDFEDQPLFVSGYISSPNFTGEKSSCRMIFLNGRVIKCDAVNKVVDSVYKEYYGKSGADFILYIRLPYAMIDVNIHPAKLEVKFLNESLVTMLIKQGIREVLKKNFILKEEPIYRSFDTKINAAENLVFEEAKNFIADKAEKVLPPIQNQTDLSDLTPFSTDTYHKEAHHIYKYEPDNDLLPQEKIDFPNQLNKEIFIRLVNMKYIGNAFGVYAMIEAGDELFAIDTHAAHERVLYDQYLMDFNNHTLSIQTLMVPVILDLSAKNYQLVLNNLNLFESLGFELDDFAHNSIAVRSMPYYLSDRDIQTILQKIIEEIGNFGTIGDVNKRSEKLIKAACHNAVRGSEDISEQETRALLKALYNTQMPFTCPHGRPVLGKLKISYFMKAFERI